MYAVGYALCTHANSAPQLCEQMFLLARLFVRVQNYTPVPPIPSRVVVRRV